MRSRVISWRIFLRGIRPLLPLAILVGNEPRGFPPLTTEKIMAHQESLPGKIFVVQGSWFGRLKEWPGAMRNPGVADCGSRRSTGIRRTGNFRQHSDSIT